MRQVKVDNWGIYFLQRLKHFFNRTDYCDLTLQFMDNAQLKVHRLVLNACTEYFDVLERTCEMYEDYLIMPEDLQADVVVPIVNFMYTGQLEYKPEMLEKLIQTAQIMNIPVLAKLLDAQRNQKTYRSKVSTNPSTSFPTQTPLPPHPITKPSINAVKRVASKPLPPPPQKKQKREVKAENITYVSRPRPPPNTSVIGFQPAPQVTHYARKRQLPPAEPRPTRCELPEELEDNVFTDSFSAMSYDSKPLIVHPETSKRYPVKQHSLFSDVITNINNKSVIDIVECKKIIKPSNDSLFEDPVMEEHYQEDMYDDNDQEKPLKNAVLSNQLKMEPKVTIESDDNVKTSNIDHAKIISEVLKKYPYLVKGNKSIKLKILDTKTKPEKKTMPAKKKPVKPAPKFKEEPIPQIPEDHSYQDVLDSKEAARLISLGAENVTGPWICLICGTPGKALNFPTYYSFRRHLVEVHNEKVVSTMCEHCGHKTNKRNHLLYHLYTKHNVPPPKNINFPKCSECNYIGQSPAALIKHKLMHSTKRKRCNICFFEFSTAENLLRHMKATGHKLSSSVGKMHLQCIYCSKTFVREYSLFVHVKAVHGPEARSDGIIEDSDEEQNEAETEADWHEDEEIHTTVNQYPAVKNQIKREPAYNTYDSEESLGHPSDLERKPRQIPVKQKVLNDSFNMGTPNPDDEEPNEDEDNYDEKLTMNSNNDQQIILSNSEFTQTTQSNDMEFYIENNDTLQTDENESSDQVLMVGAETEDMQGDSRVNIERRISEGGEQVQIVVSNEEEYKALMASNHPIIFDADGNPTKTLAVLTTPQNVPISTASIQVEGGNTENMMILPDDYATCVSQASNDGNIVVVYSQQMDGDKQQYIVDNSYASQQLVSASDLSTHFIQTSAVLTPYTTAAAAPLMPRQVVINPEMVSWDGTIPQGVVDQQNLTQEQIHLVDQQGNNMPEDGSAMVSEGVSEQPVMQYDIQEQEVLSQAENESQDTVTNEQSIESESPEEINMVVEVNNETVTELDSRTDINAQVEESIEIVHNHQMIQDNGESSKDFEESNNQENGDNAINGVSANETELAATTVMTNGADNSTDNSHRVENLTSEWSDDEVEISTAPTENSSAEEIHQEIAGAIEESIENIQQEVDSHILADEENVEEVSQEEINENIVIDSQQPNNLMKTQQKITTLLNDWEENDDDPHDDTAIEISQESAEDNVGDTSVSMEEGTLMEIVTEVDDNNVTKATAPSSNIHNLVTDWEEEEEATE